MDSWPLFIGLSWLAPLWMLFLLQSFNSWVTWSPESIYHRVIRLAALVMIPLRLTKCLDATGEHEYLSVCSRYVVHALSLDIGFLIIGCFLNMWVAVVSRLRYIHITHNVEHIIRHYIRSGSKTPKWYPLLVVISVGVGASVNEVVSVLVCVYGCFDKYLVMVNIVRFLISFSLTALTSRAMWNVYRTVQRSRETIVAIITPSRPDNKRDLFKITSFFWW